MKAEMYLAIKGTFFKSDKLEAHHISRRDIKIVYVYFTYYYYIVTPPYHIRTLERLSMTFTADGKRQRLPLFFYYFLVILK